MSLEEYEANERKFPFHMRDGKSVPLATLELFGGKGDGFAFISFDGNANPDSGALLTIPQARELARALLEAADRLEKGE